MDNIHDFFTMVEEEKSINQKAVILKENESDALKAILRSAFDPRIEWLVPETKPPFAENTEEDWKKCTLYLTEAVMSFGKFCKFNGNLTVQAKNAKFRNLADCEDAFITMMKQLHTSEADLVVELVNKRLPYKGITPRLVNQAFPGLIPE